MRKRVINDSDESDQESEEVDSPPVKKAKEEEFDLSSQMLMTVASAKRWWEGSEGFDFEQKAKTTIGDDLRTKDDPRQFIGKIVKRSFGRGIISFGKVIGWFPPDESEDEDTILWHVLHGDGDEEDLDADEVEEGIRWAEEEDEQNEKAREVLTLTVSDIKDKRSDELREFEAKRVQKLEELFKTLPSYESPAKDTNESMIRGLQFIFHLAKNPSNFVNFGSDIIQTFYDISTVAPEPVKREALQRVEVVAQMWKERYKTMRDFCEDETPSASEVNELCMGLYSLERVGVEHALKQELVQFVSRARYSVDDYLGFRAGQPGALQSLERPHSVLTQAMYSSFFASRVGVSIGVSLSTVLSHIATLRPYKLPASVLPSMDHTSWIEQITLVFNVVHIFSNFGELRLRPSTLPHEFGFLKNPTNMELAMNKRDVHIVGELCHCLRIFGIKPTDSNLSQGLQFLRDSQISADGSWPIRDPEGSEDPYARYHATMCATMALYDPIFRGFGPSTIELKALLESWTKGAPEASTGEVGSVPGVLPVIEESYTDQSSNSDQFGGQLEQRALSRLLGLLQWKKSVDVKSIDAFQRKAKRPSMVSGGAQRVPKAKVKASMLKDIAPQIGDMSATFTRLLEAFRQSQGRKGKVDFEPALRVQGCEDTRIELHSLFKRVATRGGFKSMSATETDWLKIIHVMGLPSSTPPTSLRDFYRDELEDFEDYFLEEVCLKKKRGTVQRSVTVDDGPKLPRSAPSSSKKPKKRLKKSVMSDSDSEDDDSGEEEWMEDEAEQAAAVDIDDLI